MRKHRFGVVAKAGLLMISSHLTDLQLLSRAHLTVLVFNETVTYFAASVAA